MNLSNLEKYNLLNTIKPYFESTLFPYNKISSKKIVETQKEIELVYQHNNMFFDTNRNKTTESTTGGIGITNNKVALSKIVKKISVWLYESF